MLLVGLALIVAPLWLSLSRALARSAAVSDDARELSDAFRQGVDSDSEDAIRARIATAGAQLDSFSARTQSRTDSKGVSGMGAFSIGLGGVLLGCGMYCSINYGRRVDSGVMLLKASLSDDSPAESEERSRKDTALEVFCELEKELQSRIRSFDNWIERLNNDRTDALSELEQERFSLLEKLSEQSSSERNAIDFSVKKGDFLATMSHEIRTPMNGVLAVADDLLSYDLERGIQDKVEMIKLSGESLVRILDDVLDFSKIEAGKLDVKLQSFDFIFACNATHALFTASAREKGLCYDVYIDPDVPQYVMGDSVRIRQVVANLLSNALKFTDEGGVTLTISRQTRETEGLLLSIVDTGMGIDAKAFDRIFEAFSQAESGLEEKGTGLGLAISKRLAELMDGELAYRKNEPMGSVFDFWIPYVKGAPVDDEVDLARVDPTIENARILIVEDNRINQHVIESLLERAKHEVHIASNGLDALDLIEEFEFDLIFMDCLMPKLDGFETAKRIRALPKDHANRGTPIVALTANAFAHDRELCFESGMNDFLAKPVKKETLLGAVNHHCRPREN